VASSVRVLVGALVVQPRDGPGAPGRPGETCRPRILLGRRASARAWCPSVWDMLGGHCEPGETPERALIRELQEEVGITPTAWRLLGSYDVPAAGAAPRATLHVYAVSLWTGTPRNRQPEEHDEVAWFAVEEACRLELAHPDYPTLFRRLAAER
jgi:8-oxo-dGTP diphosphatase